MREILFRGKRVSNGEWVNSKSIIRFINPDNKVFIAGAGTIIQVTATIDGDILNLEDTIFYEVDPKTLGQYTGLTDKNGIKIFEWDIVKCCDMIGTIKFENGAFGIATNDTIDYQSFEDEIKNWTFCDNEPYFCYCDNFVSFQELMWNYNLYEGECDIVEVIGNIHDTPELLEAENVLPSKKRRH